MLLNGDVQNSKLNKRNAGLAFIIGICLLCMGVWVIASVNILREGALQYRLFLLVMGTIMIVGCFGWRLWEKKLTGAEIAVGIFILSFLVRGMLILVLPYNLAQHDTHFFGAWEGQDFGSGHFGYIQYLMRFGTLPDFDPRQVWSFYNPPLHHMLAAVWMKFNHWLGMEYEMCAENLQILSLLYSSLTIYTGYQLLREFGIRGTALAVSFGVLAFHPIFAVLSLALNNDPLSILCSAIAILYTVRWYKEQRFKYIIYIALAIGMGMLTKLSVGLLAPAIAFVFLMTLIKQRKKWKRLTGQFVCFGAICIPVGLAWPIRCKVLFDISFNYVQPLGEGDMWQYVGDYTPWQRLGIPSLESVLRNPWYTGTPADQHNVWLEMFRTAVLDEWTFQLPQKGYVLLATGLLLCSILLGLAAFGTFIWVLRKKETMDNTLKGMFGIGYFALIGFFIKFCFDYPYICTENFRYIVPTLIFSVVGMGITFMEKREEDKSEKKAVKIGILFISCLFILLSFSLLTAYCLLYTQSDVQNM